MGMEWLRIDVLVVQSFRRSVTASDINLLRHAKHRWG